MMYTTPGMTEPELSKLPLGTEGEMTPGPDNINPFRSPREAAVVNEIEAMQRVVEPPSRPDERELAQQMDLDPMGDPLAEPEPFAFDEIEETVNDVQLPAMQRDNPTLFF